jgi:hypothetical protein
VLCFEQQHHARQDSSPQAIPTPNACCTILTAQPAAPPPTHLCVKGAHQQQPLACARLGQLLPPLQGLLEQVNTNQQRVDVVAEATTTWWCGGGWRDTVYLVVAGVCACQWRS